MSVVQMDMAVYPILRFISVHQLNKTFKPFVRKIARITVSCNGSVRQHNVNSTCFSNLPIQLFHAMVHLLLAVLMQSSVIDKASAKPKNPQAFANAKLILNTVASFGGIFFIRTIVIPVNIQERSPAERIISYSDNLPG